MHVDLRTISDLSSEAVASDVLLAADDNAPNDEKDQKDAPFRGIRANSAGKVAVVTAGSMREDQIAQKPVGTTKRYLTFAAGETRMVAIMRVLATDTDIDGDDLELLV